MRDTNGNAIKVIRTTIKWLKTHKWIQGDSAIDDEGNVIESTSDPRPRSGMCAANALDYHAGYYSDLAERVKGEVAITLRRKDRFEYLGLSTSTDVIVHFNDKPRRKLKDVLRVLDSTARRLSAKVRKARARS